MIEAKVLNLFVKNTSESGQISVVFSTICFGGRCPREGWKQVAVQRDSPTAAPAGLKAADKLRAGGTPRLFLNYPSRLEISSRIFAAFS